MARNGPWPMAHSSPTHLTSRREVGDFLLDNAYHFIIAAHLGATLV